MATFGKITEGLSTQTYTTNRKLVSKHTLPENALLTSLTARMRNSNTTQIRNWRGLIYADSAGAPGALLHVTADGIINSSTVSTLTAAFAGQALPAGDYWIGVQHDSNATTNVLLYRDNTAANGVSANDTFSDGAADPFGTLASNSGPFDVYIEYEPASVGPNLQLNAFFPFFES